MLSNEELFAKAYFALRLYQHDLDRAMSEQERIDFVLEFVRLEQENAAKFRL